MTFDSLYIYEALGTKISHPAHAENSPKRRREVFWLLYIEWDLGFYAYFNFIILVNFIIEWDLGFDGGFDGNISLCGTLGNPHVKYIQRLKSF